MLHADLEGGDAEREDDRAHEREHRHFRRDVAFEHRADFCHRSLAHAAVLLSKGETVGAGRRPATVSYAPAAGQSPPGCILAPGKAKGHQGGTPMAHRSAHHAPAGVRPPDGVLLFRPLAVSEYYQPAFPPPPPAKDTTIRINAIAAISHSPPSATFRFTELSGYPPALPCCVCLPTSLATTATSERHDEQDQRESCHHTPHWVWVWFLARSLRAAYARMQKQPPCHLHEEPGSIQPIDCG